MTKEIIDTEETFVVRTPEDSVWKFEDFDRMRNNAIKIILKYGMFDGAHHKQWVLDQTLRALLEDDYDITIERYNHPDYEPWDKGIAP